MNKQINPFDQITKQLEIVDSKLDKLLNPPREDYSKKYYTVNESSKILRCTRATVISRINEGRIKAKVNTIPYLIPHFELFDTNNLAKSIKYKRKA